MIKKFTSIDEVNNVTSDNIFKPQIALIGVGGAGTNAVNNMINMGLSGVKFVVVNTDSKSLESSIAPYKIQIGPKVTKGLGAGSKPEIGYQAAEESIEDLKETLRGINMLFITAGMGGGTGTGAAQVIAKIAKEMDILTISFVTKPFLFEGNQRMDIAEYGIAELEKYSDAFVVISNEKLLSVTDDKTSVSDAFRETDGVLHSGIKAITDLLVASGLVNLDFNDIKYVIEGKGRAMIGSAESSGKDRAQLVLEQAISNPLLEDVSIVGAKNVLINITGSTDMTLYELDNIISAIKQEVDPDAFINFGAIHDESLSDTLRLSIVATSLQDKEKVSILQQAKQEELQNKNFSKSNNIYKEVQKKAKLNVARLQPNGYNKEANQLNNIINKPMEEKQSTAIPYLEDIPEDYEITEIEDNNNPVKDSISEQVINEIKEESIMQESILFSKYSREENTIEEQLQSRAYNEQPLSNEHLMNMAPEISREDEKSIQEENITKDNPKIEEVSTRKASKTNIFEMIMNKKNKRDTANNQIQEDEILSIKSRNKISKQSNVEEPQEETFFGMPSFLKKDKNN